MLIAASAVKSAMREFVLKQFGQNILNLLAGFLQNLSNFIRKGGE
jgi:hypothetical protein